MSAWGCAAMLLDAREPWLGEQRLTYAAKRRAAPGAEAQGFSEGPPAGESEAAAAAWDLFWGWDCCAPGGLCERAYVRLGIARSSWTALKALPAVRCPLCYAFSHHA